MAPTPHSQTVSAPPLERLHLAYKRKVYRPLRERLRLWRADAALLSFPKCGRTWLRLLIGKALSLHIGAPDAARGDLLELEPFTFQRRELPSLLVSHDERPHRKAPAQIGRSKARYRRKNVLLLVRDPRDVIVSLYYERKKRKADYDGRLAEFVRERTGGIDSFIAFYNEWAAHRTLPRRFRLVRYEDLHTAPRAELRDALTLLGRPHVSDEHVHAAVEFAAFDNMRQMERRDEMQSDRLSPGEKDDPSSYKTRRGEVGGYADELRPAEVAFLNEKMKKLDPFFGYAPPDAE